MSHEHWIELAIGVVTTLFHVTGLLFALQAVLISRTPQAAIGWALALFIFPYGAIPLFLVFGESRFSGYTVAGSGESAALDAALERAREALEAARAAFDDRYDDASRLAERLSHLPGTAGNSARLLIDGEATFDAIFEAIDAAQDSLVVQFFIVRDDRIGEALKERLLAALRRKVRVWMLIDQVGSRALPAEYVRALREAGARVESFVTNRQWGQRFRINFRNHRKLVIVDSKVGFVGGLNVGDEYLGRSRRFGPWRDTFLRVEGPVVLALTVPFAEDWYFTTGEVPALPWRAPDRPAGGMRMFTIPSSPAETWNVCQAAFLEILHDVRDRLWIASPYFVPDQSLRSAIAHAALRGVDVRILLPTRPDHLLPWLSSFTFYPSMHAAGVKIYRYRDGFMHQKVLLADDAMAIVGSINTDYRSFMLNFELSVAVNDRGFAAQVERMLEADFARAERADLTLYERGSVVFRLTARLAALLSPQQ